MYPGYWRDAGHVADLLDINRFVLEAIEPWVHGKVDDNSQVTGRVQIAHGAEIHNSRVVGPAIIGQNTIVADSYIGPFTSLAENCSIDHGQIEFSIVLCNSSITGAGRIDASLIGRDVVITSVPAVQATV